MLWKEVRTHKTCKRFEVVSRVCQQRYDTMELIDRRLVGAMSV